MKGKKFIIGAAICAGWLAVVEGVALMRAKRGLKIGYESEYSGDDISRFRELEEEERQKRKMES